MKKTLYIKGISALICTIQQIISLIKTFRELKKNVDLTTRNFYKELTKKVFGAIANIVGTAGVTYLVCTVIGTCIGGIPGKTSSYLE